MARLRHANDDERCPSSREERTPQRYCETDVNDPNVWSGRALQVDFVELAVNGLASMYPAFDWSVVLLAIMDISARAISLAELGHSGHQCSHAPGRPILHLFSSSRRPRRVVTLYSQVIRRTEARSSRKLDRERGRSKRCA